MVKNAREYTKGRIFELRIACVASVSVEFGNKDRPRNGIFGVFPARKMEREPKNERGGGGAPKIPFL